jgi:hypothetical protein
MAAGLDQEVVLWPSLANYAEFRNLEEGPINNQQYRAMVDDAAERLPGAWQRIGTRQVKQLPPAGAAVYFTLQFPAGDVRQGFQIVYRRHDIYIMGFRTKGGISYACNNQLANVPGALNLGFNDAYGTLGWDRQTQIINQGGGPKIDVPALDFALTRANNGQARQFDVLCMVVALAEGVRFMSVEKAVRGKLPIGTAMVDWDQQLAADDAVLKPG